MFRTSLVAIDGSVHAARALVEAVDLAQHDSARLTIMTRPADRILEQLKEGGHDLVVVGSRGRGNGRSLVLGRVSHQVINAAPAAVLVVHADPPEVAGAAEA